MADQPEPIGAQPATIALVDDDRNILTSVSMALQAEGFLTRVYADGENALRALRDNPADLGVFDIKMPRMDGLELLRRLRETSAMPVIFLTSKDDELDEETGLAEGADDYIAKPFSQRLLIARIRTILRRTAPRPADSAAVETSETILSRGRLEMDSASHRVRWDAKDVALTVTEFMILETLAQRPDVVKSRNQLMDAAYHDDVYVDDRTIDSHIKRIRRKFQRLRQRCQCLRRELECVRKWCAGDQHECQRVRQCSQCQRREFDRCRQPGGCVRGQRVGIWRRIVGQRAELDGARPPRSGIGCQLCCLRQRCKSRRKLEHCIRRQQFGGWRELVRLWPSGRCFGRQCVGVWCWVRSLGCVQHGQW